MPHKDPEARRVYRRERWWKNHDRLYNQERERRLNRSPKQKEHEREYRKYYYLSNIERIKAYQETYLVRLKDAAFIMIPNECYYKSHFCDGPLEWDHKYGDGKEWRKIPRNQKMVLIDIAKNPDRWMRLCRKHNQMKMDIPKDEFEAMISDIYERVCRALPKLDGPSLPV